MIGPSKLHCRLAAELTLQPANQAQGGPVGGVEVQLDAIDDVQRGEGEQLPHHGGADAVALPRVLDEDGGFGR